MVPGDLEIERRIRAFIRWNAAVMVSSANRKGLEVGGHIATYQSSASLYEVGSTTSSAARTTPAAATRSTSRATAPGIYARAFLEGRLSEEQLYRFRQEVQHGPARDPVVPAPAVDARLLGVPDRLDGPDRPQLDLPGAVQPLPGQPGHQGHQRPACGRSSATARWASPSRSARSGSPRGARQPHLGHQLQPAAARRAGHRQRQDHPGAQANFRGAGWNVIKVVWGAGWDACSPATSTACWSTR